MSFTVIVQETALRALARIRAEDKDAFASIRRALATLAEQPHPDEAVAWGGSGIWAKPIPTSASGAAMTAMDKLASRESVVAHSRPRR